MESISIGGAPNSVSRNTATAGLHVDPRRRVRDLGVGERQRVEILQSARTRHISLLLLDEPTAVHSRRPKSKQRFDDFTHAPEKSGCTIVIVTHKLDEVFSLASHVTVLRRGERGS